MVRDLDAAWDSYATAANCQIARLFEGVFEGGFVLYLWNGVGDLSYDSKTWLGNGWLQSVTPAADDQEITATNLEVILAGVPQTLLSIVLGLSRMNSVGRYYWGFLDTDGSVVAPQLQFEGKFDTADIIYDPNEPMIKLIYETELVELERTTEFRFNHETQRHFYPEDRGFEYVASLQDKPLFWGNSPDPAPPKGHERRKKKQGKGSKDKRR